MARGTASRSCERILARGPSGRRRRGQRGQLPRAAHRRGAVRAHRLVQSRSRCAGAACRRHTPGFPSPTTSGGRRSRTSTRAPTGRCGAVQRLGAGGWAPHRCPSSISSTPRERLNLYVYPEEIDYIDRRPLDATWQRLDSSVRQTETAFDAARRAASAGRTGRPLIYLSLGSLGSADVELMERLVAELAETPHRYIVSTRATARGLRAAHRTCGARSSCPRRSVLAAGRHGDHARRQQHRHREPPLRQAHRRAARSSGTSTTTLSASTRPATVVRVDTYHVRDRARCATRSTRVVADAGLRARVARCRRAHPWHETEWLPRRATSRQLPPRDPRVSDRAVT